MLDFFSGRVSKSRKIGGLLGPKSMICSNDGRRSTPPNTPAHWRLHSPESLSPGSGHWSSKRGNMGNKHVVGGFNPFEKYYSKWESFPGRGENEKYLKPHFVTLCIALVAGKDGLRALT